jgi:hypothetical protein
MHKLQNITKRYRYPGAFVYEIRYLDKLHRGSVTGIESMSVKLVHKLPCKIPFHHQIQTSDLTPLQVTQIILALLDSKILLPI